MELIIHKTLNLLTVMNDNNIFFQNKINYYVYI